MLVNPQREPAERLFDTCANAIKVEGGAPQWGRGATWPVLHWPLTRQIAETLKRIQLPQIMKLDIQIKLE